MVSDGRQFLLEAWWVSTLPGLAILALVLSINLAAQGLRDAFDPRLHR
jgi:ABC-type dipeptide/oligopeptide/nickel transport system permease subunit